MLSQCRTSLRARWSGVWITAGERDFSPKTPKSSLGPTQRPFQCVPELFAGDKLAVAWGWPLTSTWCRGQELAELNFHSSIRLRGVYVYFLKNASYLSPFSANLNQSALSNCSFKINFHTILHAHKRSFRQNMKRPKYVNRAVLPGSL